MSLLELEYVKAFYGASQALFDVSMSIEAGQVVALLGRNGMGKTTTIRVICRLLKHSASENLKGLVTSNSP